MNFTAFPLLLLPNTIKMKAVRNMDLYEQCALSVCSKTTKSLVKSLNIEAIHLEIDIQETLTLTIEQNKGRSYVGLEFYNDQNPKRLTSLTGQLCVSVDSDPDTNNTEWKESFNGVRGWINHFMNVFDLLEVEDLLIRGDLIELNSLMECMNGLTIMKLRVMHLPGIDHTSEEYYQQILNIFLPRTFLKLTRGEDEPTLINPRILTQNVSMFTAINHFKITLNDLLMANSNFMELSGDYLSSKDVNRFLKLWMLGCNPKMNYLLLSTEERNQFNIMETLEDIDLMAIPEGIERKFPKNFKELGRHYQEIIKGGFDIVRNDGTIATVHFGYWELLIFVWN